MMKENKKTHWYALNAVELFITFVSLLVIGNALLLNKLIFLIILLPLIYLIITEIQNWQKLILISGIILIYVLLITLTSYEFSISKLNEIINKKVTNFYQLRFNAINHINKIYKNSTPGYYINMLIFNYRDKNSYEIYNLTKQINITHLITVSGLQINILFGVLQKLFLKHLNKPKLSNFVELILCGIYTYFLAFSISILRILTNTLIKQFNYKLSQDSNYYSAIILMFIFKNQVVNYGFLMSYLCVIGIKIVIQLTKNKLLLAILINLYCVMITFPLVVVMNGKINIFAFFYNYMFSSILIFEYLWFMLTAWFIWFTPFNNWIINTTTTLIKINVSLGIYLDFKNFKTFFSASYYLIWSSLGSFTIKKI